MRVPHANVRASKRARNPRVPSRAVTSDPPPEYPPARHVLRDLRLTVEHRADGTSTAWMPVVAHLETGSGAMRAGALATLVDVLGGGLAAIAAQPDWIATADLTLHLLPRVPKGQVAAHGRVLRHGRTTVVIEVRLEDGDGTALGLATMSFAVLTRRDGNLAVDQNESVRRMTMATDDSGFVAPLYATLGLRVLEPADGVIELPLVDYVRNSLGALQGRMIATAVHAA